MLTNTLTDRQDSCFISIDLPDVVDTLLRIFADDTKSYDKIENTEDQVKLQNSIDNLVK